MYALNSSGNPNAEDESNFPNATEFRRKVAMVTIRDVAKESGFSSTTVSIVLNNAPLARYIPAVTKKRIEKAAQKLGYRPNQFARSLRSKRSHTVGVMVFDMTDPYLHADACAALKTRSISRPTCRF